MAICLVYVTAGTEGEALSIAKTVVEERLAACANILGKTTSIFRWQDAVQQETEVSFLLKTTPALRKRLIERIVDLHSYDCPCAIALETAAAHGAFSDWVKEETEQPCS